MIIKRVPLGEQAQQLPFLPFQEKTITPRVIIKMKKTAKVQLCQQVSEESVPEGETNFFNDTDYFNYQHKKVDKQRHQKQALPHKTQVHPIRTKPKQILSDGRLHQTFTGTRQDPSRNLFIQFLKKESFQATQTSQLLTSQNSTQRQRKYSCPSNRKDVFEAPCPVFTRGPYSQKQSQSFQELERLNIKINKANQSCYVVNPYTQKEYFHQRVTQSSNQQRKNFRSLDYSIIKPNEIKAVPFSNRDEKAMHKRKTERKHFPELIAALKRKEDIWAGRTRGHRQEMRMLVHTSYVNRKKEIVLEEKNEVLPWEVEGQPNFTDIL